MNQYRHTMLTRTSIVLLGSVLLILTGAWQLRLWSRQTEPVPSLRASHSVGRCHSEAGLIYVHQLSSDTPEAMQAASKLLDVAKESRDCRDAVIKEIVAALNQADLQNDPSVFRLWTRGSGILGELKAVESLDLLINHLDLNDGFFSSSMAHQPVVRAVERMGVVAVPKLGLALKNNPNRDIRLAAALCLGDIDGSEAVHELNSALESEKDPCVRRLITLLLPSSDDPSNRPITAKDGEILRQRILAFRCGN